MSTLLEQASLIMIPSGYKEDVVYSVIPETGAGDLSFTRASNGTRINSAGLVEVTPWNLMSYSEQFDNAFWNKATSGSATFVVTANQTTAPNGTNTADLVSITRSATSELAAIYTSVGQGIGTFKNSIWLKAKDNSNVGKTIDLWSWESATRGYTKITLTADWVRYEQDTTVFTGSASELFDFGLLPITYSTSTTLAVEFYAWGGQSNIGSTAKPYFPTTDRLNVPRLTYQNGGGGCPSLLLEKQSTNLFTYSEQLQTGTSGTITVTPNTAISPDGTQNADSLSTSGYLIKSLSATAGTYTYSVFAKYLSQNTINISIYDGVYYDATYNVSTGVVSSSSAGVTASIQNMGNGWYRCIMTATTANNVSEVGFNTGNVYAWGCQFEAGSYATSYISTTSASATRVADACSKTGISSLIGQTEGVLFVDVSGPSKTVDSRYIAVSDGTGVNRILFFQSATSTTSVYWQSSAGSGALSFTTINGRMKLAVGYKNNDFVVYCNGVLKTSTTSAPISMTLNTLCVGTYEDGTIPNSLDQSVNEAILFPTRLTNAELAQLTGNQNYTINQAYASYGVASESPNCVQP